MHKFDKVWQPEINVNVFVGTLRFRGTSGLVFSHRNRQIPETFGMPSSRALVGSSHGRPLAERSLIGGKNGCVTIGLKFGCRRCGCETVVELERR